MRTQSDAALGRARIRRGGASASLGCAMGSFLGSAVESANEEIEECRWCEGRRATWRGEWQGSVEVDEKGRPAPERYPELAPYWYRTLSGGTFQYMACDGCVTYEVCELFTHHPGGWLPEEKDYEPLRAVELEGGPR